MMWGSLYKNGRRAAASTQPTGPVSRRSHACARRLRHQPLGSHGPRLFLLHHGLAGAVSRLCCGDHNGVGSSEDGKWTSLLCLSFLIYVQFSPQRLGDKQNKEPISRERERAKKRETQSSQIIWFFEGKFC